MTVEAQAPMHPHTVTNAPQWMADRDLSDAMIRAAIHGTLALVCRWQMLDLGYVEMQLLRRGELTQDRNWTQASHARQAAIYLVNTVIGVQQYEIARAIGFKRAGVLKAIRTTSDRCDDPAFEKMIDAITETMKGER